MTKPENKSSQTTDTDSSLQDAQSAADGGEQVNDVVNDNAEQITMPNGASDDASASNNEVDELATAHEEIAKLKDSFLRAKAEQDNIRRRSEKEVANSRKFAVESFAKEMLNVRDSLKLASTVELAEDVEDSLKSIYEGVAITLKQLDSALAKFAIVEITPEVGDKLDPNLHQAMSVIASDEVESGCVIDIIQVGFKMHDRLLRPAMVVVAS